MTVSSPSFSSAAGVSDPEASGATSSANAGLGTSSLSQFDKTLGVLTGVTINVTSTRTQTVSTTSTDGPNNGTNSSVTTTGTGSSTARLQAPGVDSTFASITASDNCTGARLGACGDGATSPASVTTNLNAAVPSLTEAGSPFVLTPDFGNVVLDSIVLDAPVPPTSAVPEPATIAHFRLRRRHARYSDPRFRYRIVIPPSAAMIWPVT